VKLLTAVKTRVFWVMTPCLLVCGSQVQGGNDVLTGAELYCILALGPSQPSACWITRALLPEEVDWSVRLIRLSSLLRPLHTLMVGHWDSFSLHAR
jgi:hypothetical protein